MQNSKTWKVVVEPPPASETARDLEWSYTIQPTNLDMPTSPAEDSPRLRRQDPLCRRRWSSIPCKWHQNMSIRNIHFVRAKMLSSHVFGKFCMGGSFGPGFFEVTLYTDTYTPYISIYCLRFKHRPQISCQRSSCIDTCSSRLPSSWIMRTSVGMWLGLWKKRLVTLLIVSRRLIAFLKSKMGSTDYDWFHAICWIATAGRFNGLKPHLLCQKPGSSIAHSKNSFSFCPPQKWVPRAGDCQEGCRTSASWRRLSRDDRGFHAGPRVNLCLEMSWEQD